MQLCINCVTPMKKQSKKLGSKSVWLVCPECGLRERENAENYHDGLKLQQQKDNKKFTQNTDRYYEG